MIEYIYIYITERFNLAHWIDNICYILQTKLKILLNIEINLK